MPGPWPVVPACATTAPHMTRSLLHILVLVPLTVLASCGGGSRSGPSPTPTPVVSGTLTVSVLSAYGTKETGGVKLHVTIRYVETAGGSTTLTRVEFTVKRNGVAGATYASTDSHVVGAKGSLEINYETNEANNDPYPTSLDVTATYTDSAGAAKTATASGVFTPLPS